MKNFYEKPKAELIEFEIEDRLMDFGEDSQGIGDAGDEEEL